jgi:hypothetical protein
VYLRGCYAIPVDRRIRQRLGTFRSAFASDFSARLFYEAFDQLSALVEDAIRSDALVFARSQHTPFRHDSGKSITEC